jgi:hypothetical protein
VGVAQPVSYAPDISNQFARARFDIAEHVCVCVHGQ